MVRLRVSLSADRSREAAALALPGNHFETDDDVFRGVDEGGWMIPYEDEDREIRKRYQAALQANGVTV